VNPRAEVNRQYLPPTNFVSNGRGIFQNNTFVNQVHQLRGTQSAVKDGYSDRETEPCEVIRCSVVPQHPAKMGIRINQLQPKEDWSVNDNKTEMKMVIGMKMGSCGYGIGSSFWDFLEVARETCLWILWRRRKRLSPPYIVVLRPLILACHDGLPSETQSG
jgi:hypothetical protein